MCLIVEDFFGRFRSFPCCADSCGSGVLISGGEPRVFLLCHLSLISPWLFVNAYFSIRALVSMGLSLFFKKLIGNFYWDSVKFIN